MITIKNEFIPFDGYVAITLWPLVFVRRDLRQEERRHEEIHGRQQVETTLAALALLAVAVIARWLSPWWLLSSYAAFYLWYVLEWVVRIFLTGGDERKAYYDIAAEQEAYAHQWDGDYLSRRRPFAWLRFLFVPKRG